MSYATGAELPSELLHRIVVLCRAAILSHDGETETFGKKGLAACSLTCRYWAIIIRPKLFETLVLRSYQDAAQLASFLTTPTTLEPSIQEYIRSIEISLCEPARFSETSWVHLVDLCRRIPSLAHNSSITWDRGLNLTMKGVQEGGSNLKQSMRSDTLLPATVLPRTVPVSSLRLKKLVLSDLTLRSVRDLIRFITSLHTWEKASLDIERITFLQGLREADRTQPRRRHGGSNVFMRHCFDKSHFADALRLAIILAGAHSIVEGARGFWLAEQFMLAFPWQDEPEIPAINIWRAKVQGGTEYCYEAWITGTRPICVRVTQSDDKTVPPYVSRVTVFVDGPRSAEYIPRGHTADPHPEQRRALMDALVDLVGRYRLDLPVIDIAQFSGGGLRFVKDPPNQTPRFARLLADGSVRFRRVGP